ncbi:peptidylprolyl isomerase [Candidatus Woesearchaeota archaeon]|nr:peptidylprolyl isomerase [Candidatus Woesearchaeota archaeon]
MKKIKINDFIKLEYTARIKNTNEIFDLTSEELAKKEGIFNKEINYGPKIICVGQKEILSELDNFLINKELNKGYKIELSPEQTFGNRNNKLIKTLNTQNLLKQKINPYPGMQLNLGNLMGIIRSVTNGRTLIDFNHPLAGKVLSYELKIIEIIEDPKLKLESLLKNTLNVELELEINEKTAIIYLELPKTTEEKLKDLIKKLIPELENIVFQKKRTKK